MENVEDVDDAGDVIRSNAPGSFPYSVLRERHPALIRRVWDAFPYDPERQGALDALLRESTDPAGVMEPLPADARDREQWEAWGSGEHVGGSWFDAPFLWAESYFYRRLLGAVGYYDAAGPWRGIDPFRPFKQAELRSPEAQAELTALDHLAQEPPEPQARALLHGSLWGNRADLGFRLTANATDTSTTPSWRTTRNACGRCCRRGPGTRSTWWRTTRAANWSPTSSSSTTSCATHTRNKWSSS